MSQQKPPIRIKLKIGNVEAEIQCEESQLKNAVEQLLSAVQKQAKETGTLTERYHPTLRGETCKDIVKRLWQEGWFSVARSLGEVCEETSRKGYNYDRTAIAHTLVDLVREGYLTRTGRPRSYTYLQKRPPR